MSVFVVQTNKHGLSRLFQGFIGQKWCQSCCICFQLWVLQLSQRAFLWRRRKIHHVSSVIWWRADISPVWSSLQRPKHLQNTLILLAVTAEGRALRRISYIWLWCWLVVCGVAPVVEASWGFLRGALGQCTSSLHTFNQKTFPVAGQMKF